MLFHKIIKVAKINALSSVLQERLLVKSSRQCHAPTKITFDDNQHKFDFLNGFLNDNVTQRMNLWPKNECSTSFIILSSFITEYCRISPQCNPQICFLYNSSIIHKRHNVILFLNTIASKANLLQCLPKTCVFVFSGVLKRATITSTK